jgi:ferric-dicitrate binding protein FerR (iron transport regulator)
MSDHDDLIGIRPDDLTPAEREAQRALLSTDVSAVREHREAEVLAEELARLPRLEGPSLEEALAHREAISARPPSRRRGWRGLKVAFALAAAVALAVMPRFLLTPEGIAQGSIHLSALIQEGRVFFTVTAEEPGYLVLVQEGRGQLWPETQQTVLLPGVHRIGPEEGIPLELDVRRGPAFFRAMLCEDPGDVRGNLDRCAMHAVAVETG